MAASTSSHTRYPPRWARRIFASGASWRSRMTLSGVQWIGGGMPMSAPAWKTTHRPSADALRTTAAQAGSSTKKPWYSGCSLMPRRSSAAARSSSSSQSGLPGCTLPKERSPGCLSAWAAKSLMVREGLGEVAMGRTRLKSMPARRAEAVSRPGGRRYGDGLLRTGGRRPGRSPSSGREPRGQLVRESMRMEVDDHGKGSLLRLHRRQERAAKS